MRRRRVTVHPHRTLQLQQRSIERLCRGTPKQATPSHPPRLLCTFPHERSLAPGTGPREFSGEPACLA